MHNKIKQNTITYFARHIFFILSLNPIELFDVNNSNVRINTFWLISETHFYPKQDFSGLTLKACLCFFCKTDNFSLSIHSTRSAFKVLLLLLCSHGYFLMFDVCLMGSGTQFQILKSIVICTVVHYECTIETLLHSQKNQRNANF